MFAYNLKLTACIRCKRSDRKHSSLGLCRTCISQVRMQDPVYREKRKEWNKRYKEKFIATKGKEQFYATRRKYDADFRKSESGKALRKVIRSKESIKRLLAGKSKIKDGLVISIDGVRVQTNIRPPKNDSEQDTTFKQVDLFKKAYKKLNK